MIKPLQLRHGEILGLRWKFKYILCSGSTFIPVSWDNKGI